MRKEVSLFLEYKFRDFTDDELKYPKAFFVMASLEKLNEQRVQQIKRLGFKFGISLVSFPGANICPVSSEGKNYLLKNVGDALIWNPDVIWFDHLRFEGKWERLKNELVGTHIGCEFCKGKDRTLVIKDLAQNLREEIPSNIKIGYFAVPCTSRDFEGRLQTELGQNHSQLCNIFDYVSPMLYHRMINKPVSYIGEYIGYLASLKMKAKILPIVQLKDMPDDLDDKLTLTEIKEEVRQALTPPSIGVAVFSWDQTIGKDKIAGVAKILNSINQ